MSLCPLFLFLVFFLDASFPSFSHSSFTRQTGCLFGLAAAAKCNLSVTEVLVMFNPFRAVRRGNQSRGEKKRNRPVLPAAALTPIPGCLTRNGNPWELERGQTHLGNHGKMPHKNNGCKWLNPCYHNLTTYK